MFVGLKKNKIEGGVGSRCMIITVCVKLQYKGFSFSYYDMIGVISCMMPD